MIGYNRINIIDWEASYNKLLERKKIAEALLETILRIDPLNEEEIRSNINGLVMIIRQVKFLKHKLEKGYFDMSILGKDILKTRYELYQKYNLPVPEELIELYKKSKINEVNKK